MASMGAVKYMGMETMVGMIKGLASSVDIPVCLHFDHATDIEMIKEAIRAGFTSVMIDSSAKDYETNIAETKAIVKFAQLYGCSVESELGKVGGKEEHIEVDDASVTFTDPADVPRFVEETGIDALAIAFGTVHGFYKREPKLDFERLDKISKIVDIPLVLHGGTGVPTEDFKKCIQMGMGKINVGTELKDVYTKSLRDALTNKYPDEIDPRKFLGEVKKACAKAVEDKIDIFGCANKAWKV